MKRREFVTLVASTAVSWPVCGHTQQAKRVFKIGHIESGSPSSSPHLLAAFQQGLRELGYIEGQDVFIERRYAEGRRPTLQRKRRTQFRLYLSEVGT
jgi:putative tryptophan/tyrosine transport system substrate-binding protein